MYIKKRPNKGIFLVNCFLTDHNSHLVWVMSVDLTSSTYSAIMTYFIYKYMLLRSGVFITALVGTTGRDQHMAILLLLLSSVI